MSSDRSGTDGSDGQTSRRDYLKLAAGAAASTPVLSSAAGRANAASVPPGEPSPDGSQIGGGQEYDRKVSGGEYTVRTRDALIQKLENEASSGETVYIPNDAKINLGSRTGIRIPDGVTLASGRGINGAAGGLLYTDEHTGGDPFFEVRSKNVRITGLRMRGPNTSYFNPGPDANCPDDPGADHQDCLDARESKNTKAVLLFYEGCEIDNCEMYGWPLTAVMSGVTNKGPIDPHIHHNSFHNNQMEGFGYGVRVTTGHPTIEWNFFDRNRHSIAAKGGKNCGYTAQYNLVDEATSHAFDMHPEDGYAGNTINIRRNTFTFVDSHVENYSASEQEAITIRGEPRNVVNVTKNWFYHPSPPDGENMDQQQGGAFRQKNTNSEWRSFEFSNNHFGKDEPPKGVGAPRSDSGGGGGGGGGGSSIGAEVGQFAKDADSWKSAPFSGSYTDPVVIMKPTSQFNGANPCHARIRNVSGSGYEYKIEEWDYLNGIHRPETISYLVMEEGTHTVNGTQIEVGRMAVDEKFSRLSFTQDFSTKPVVFTQTQSYNGSNAVVTRNTHVNANRFDVRLQEEKGQPQDQLGHVEESVGYIAIEPGSVDLGSKSVDIGRMWGATDSWQRLTFNGSFSSPRFVADFQTMNGGDTATLRYKALDPGGVDIEVEEETREDSETNHIAETVGYFATSGGGQL